MGEKKWKNFLSIWKKDSGPLQGSGILSFEALAKVMKDQNVCSADDAREFYRAAKKCLGDELNMNISVWRNDQKTGKQPDFQVGYNTPYDKGKGSEGKAQSAPADDVPF